MQSIQPNMPQKEIEREAVGEEMMMIIDKKGIHALKGKTNATILI